MMQTPGDVCPKCGTTEHIVHKYYNQYCPYRVCMDCGNTWRIKPKNEYAQSGEEKSDEM